MGQCRSTMCCQSCRKENAVVLNNGETVVLKDDYDDIFMDNFDDTETPVVSQPSRKSGRRPTPRSHSNKIKFKAQNY